MAKSSFIYFLMLTAIFVLSACDSAPSPELMKASKQFESDEIRDNHIAYMRKNHMDALKHKRDETVYNGIRTEHHSLNACINCHVPESYNGKVLRHTDPEHFCSTCHNYVAAKLDCFECHVDHPVSEKVVDNEIETHSDFTLQGLPNPIDIKKEKPLSRSVAETTLARSDDGPKGVFFIVNKRKTHKSGGVSFLVSKQPEIALDTTFEIIESIK